eukprot:3679827-Amphidinium_carterae.1
MRSGHCSCSLTLKLQAPTRQQKQKRKGYRQKSGLSRATKGREGRAFKKLVQTRRRYTTVDG